VFRNFWSGILNVQRNIGNKARGGCFARAPVETALCFDLGRADRDGLLDAANLFPAPSMVHLTHSSASALKNYGASALNLESRESLGSPRQNDS
jgi:hypothetical protein